VQNKAKISIPQNFILISAAPPVLCLSVDK